MITALHICDAEFLIRERAMLRRLRLGLADEGVRVVSAVPESVEAMGDDGLLGRTVTFTDHTFGLVASLRARGVQQQLAEEPAAKDGVDVVHAFGGAVWPMAVSLARSLNASLAVEVWRAQLGARVRSLRHAMRRNTDDEREAGELIAMTPDRAMSLDVRREAPWADVRIAPWGVHAPPKPADPFNPDRVPSLVLLGGGRDTEAFEQAFRGIATLFEEFPDLMIFLDAQAAHRAGIWATAKKLGVQNRVSLVDRVEAERDLCTQCDAMIYPEARGERRTILLDAMAAGMPIIAATDGTLDWLRDGETAILMKSRSRAAWAETVGDLIRNPERAKEVAQRARGYVRTEHRATTQVSAVLDAYEAIAGRRRAAAR